MSKGLGTLQRKIIEAGGATKTIWQCGIPLSVRVAHDEEKEAGEVKVKPKTGTTWQTDGKPWFECHTTITTPEQIAQLRASFRRVDLDYRMTTDNEATLPACISMPHIRCIIFPEQIAIGRNIANASISRAISSMVKRGLVEWGSITNERCPSLMDRWKHYDRGRLNLYGRPNTYEWHNILVVLDSRATCPVDIITPSNA